MKNVEVLNNSQEEAENNCLPPLDCLQLDCYLRRFPSLLEKSSSWMKRGCRISVLLQLSGKR